MRAALLLLSLVLLPGCIEQNPDELDRLVKEDPAFKQMIAARDESRSNIRLIKQDMLLRKKTMDSQVEKLRAEYDAYAKAQNQTIEQHRAKIEKDREQLKLEVETASASLDRKSAELAGYRKTLADVRKVLTESKGITLSKTERQKWEERILMLSEKMRPLSEEIQELRLAIRLKRQKIGYLNG